MQLKGDEDICICEVYCKAIMWHVILHLLIFVINYIPLFINEIADLKNGNAHPPFTLSMIFSLSWNIKWEVLQNVADAFHQVNGDKSLTILFQIIWSCLKALCEEQTKILVAFFSFLDLDSPFPLFSFIVWSKATSLQWH